jgi:fatty-acyl-CoA synthase
MDWSYPLLAACEHNPQRVAVRYRGAELSFAELERRVAALTAGLRQAGAAGQTVAWMLPNVPEAIELSMALARIGAVSVPLNPRLRIDEIDYMLGDSNVQRLVIDPSLSDDAHALAARPQALLGVAQLRDAGTGATTPDATLEIADDALATVLYTSETTGFPKGVMRSHRANAWNVMNCALGSPRTPDDIELFNLPSFGIGLLHFAIPALLGGATLVLDHLFAPDRAWQLLQEERATRTFLAPTMLSAMLAIDRHDEFDLSALTTIYTAYSFPEPLRRRALERFGDRFVFMYGLTEVYGLTEAQLTCACPGEFAAAPDSVGGAMGAMRVSVRDPQGRALSAGEVGEIALQGPAMMDGYLNRSDDTAQSLRGGWVLTGDLGRIDVAGDLHYTGRVKEMIKTGGFSVHPVEVERALLAIDGIDEAAVIGVPDPHWGEMIVAYVVAVKEPLDVEATTRACRPRLAGFKVPKADPAADGAAGQRHRQGRTRAAARAVRRRHRRHRRGRRPRRSRRELAVEPGDLPNALEWWSVTEGAVGASLVVVSDPVWQ